MKYGSFLLFLLILSCSTLKSPSEVVKEFLHAVDHFDYKTAKTLVIQSEFNLHKLDEAADMDKIMTVEQRNLHLEKISKTSYTVTSKEETDSTSIVFVGRSDLPADIQMEIRLKKVNGTWLIDSFHE